MTKSEYNRIDYIEEVMGNAFELLDTGRVAAAKEIIRAVNLQLRVLKRTGEKRYGNPSKAEELSQLAPLRSGARLANQIKLRRVVAASLH